MSPHEMGVPQGCSIGPMQFSIIISGMVELSSLLKFNLFAEDTTIHLLDCDEINLSNIMNAELVKVCNWILRKKRALNFYQNTISPILGQKTMTNTFQLYMFNSVTCRKIITKFLGLIVDNKISWKSHTKHAHCEVSKLNGLLCRVS